MELMLRRRAIMSGAGESNVYIPNLIPAYLNTNSTYHLVSASENTYRIGFFGAGAQAGRYTTNSGTDEYRLPVIKLPRNTASITISFTSVTRLYNDDNVYICWTKDVPSDEQFPYAAYFILEQGYNARADSGALAVNTLSVPEGADSFVGLFRINPAIGQDETPYTIAEDVGFSITFNKQ